MASIYGFIDEDGDLRYIGKANNLRERMQKHMYEIGRRRTPVYDWLAKHGEPVMIVLESDCEDWRSSEREWIAEARLAGAPLLNLADGGDEPLCTREQHRENGRKSIASGAGFTSEQARAHGFSLNKRLRNDPEARKLRDIKRYVSAHIARYGFTPKRLANLWYAAWAAPEKFGKWFDRLTDRHDHFVRDFTESDWVAFHNFVLENVDGSSNTQNS